YRGASAGGKRRTLFLRCGRRRGFIVRRMDRGGARDSRSGAGLQRLKCPFRRDPESLIALAKKWREGENFHSREQKYTFLPPGDGVVMTYNWHGGRCLSGGSWVS